MYIRNRYEIGDKVRIKFSSPEKVGIIISFEYKYTKSKKDDNDNTEEYSINYRLHNDPYMRKEEELERVESIPDDEDLVNKVIIDANLKVGNFDFLKRFTDEMKK